MDIYLVPGTEGDVKAFRARELLLLSLRTRAPGVISRMLNELLPVYREIFTNPSYSVPFDAADRDVDHTARADDFTDWFEREAAVGNPVVEPLADAIDRLLDETSLRADWMRDSVLRSPRGWETAPETAGTGNLIVKPPLSWRGMPAELTTLQIEIPRVWEPRSESEGQARKRALDDMKAALDAHFDRVRGAFVEAGYKKVSLKLSADHFDDFVERGSRPGAGRKRIVADPARIAVDFEKPDLDALRDLAEKRDTSVADLIRRAVGAYLKRAQRG